MVDQEFTGGSGGAQQVRARPILFSGDMICALLCNQKVQTRREIKGDNAWHGCLTGDCPHDQQAQCDAELLALCPYGKPGDLLYAREMWRVAARYNGVRPRDIPPRTCTVAFAAGGSIANHGDGEWTVSDQSFNEADWMGKTRPGIFLPRWASRLTLRIVDVRVQRLQEISEDDAKAEGAGLTHGRGRLYSTYKMAYADLWDSINGAGAWGRNPWVFALSFSVIHKNVDEVLRG